MTRIEKYQKLRNQIKLDSNFLAQRSEMLKLLNFYKKNLDFVLAPETKQQIKLIEDNLLANPFNLEQELPVGVRIGEIGKKITELNNSLETLNSETKQPATIGTIPEVRAFTLQENFHNNYPEVLNYKKYVPLLKTIVENYNEYDKNKRAIKYNQTAVLDEQSFDPAEFKKELDQYRESIKKLRAKNKDLNIELFKSLRKYKVKGRYIY